MVPKSPDKEMPLPKGSIEPLGYVVLQHGIRDKQPPRAYRKWIDRFPEAYRSSVLAQQEPVKIETTEDEYCLATIKHYRSLMPMAMEARKPIFELKPADGAIGAHLYATERAREDFENLANQIVQKVNLASSRVSESKYKEEMIGR